MKLFPSILLLIFTFFIFANASEAHAACTYSVSETNPLFQTPFASNRGITVTTQDGCAWTATSNADWITVTDASGVGTGSFSYAVTSNETGHNQRVGIITVAGLSVTIYQPGERCTYTVKQPGSIPSSGGFYPKVIVANNPFCIIDNRSVGSGVIFIFSSENLTAFPNYAPFSRLVSLRLYVSPFVGVSGGIGVNGGIIVIDSPQAAACTFSLAETTHNFSATGGTSIFQLNSSAPSDQCQPVGASAQSSSSFVTLENPQASATAGISYTVAPNTTTQPRAATVTLTPRVDSGTATTFTLNITQSAGSCAYSLSQASQNFTATGGSFVITVNAQPGCSFTTVTNNDFITIDYGTTGTGTQNVGIFVTANNTGAARTGTLSIGGQTFTVNQSANEKKRIRLRIP